ncbi:MAG TPA: tRNA dihydrouridine(20/20a) synthase DusA [Burkholderiaceae bacterium]|nr:tRNA dihydrouridine(20/20a) synthase DusA [Burkholderiaceae bacterium]
MVDVTDKHSRYFHRLLAPKARLYTEMIATGALLYGDVKRHLDFNVAEHPLALQLGGSDPHELAAAARIGADYGYDEINLNCGCPSERVQKGAFGACLMAQPQLVVDCLKAMQDVVDVPVTVKHRLGLDDNDSYSFVRDFVGTLREAGCRVFIVHARNAILQGLSPKENRQIPPLRYDDAYQLKLDFPDCQFILNGGIHTAAQARHWQGQFDGVMLGRAAWHTPQVLNEISRLSHPQLPFLSEQQLIQAMQDYAQQEIKKGHALRHIVRPMIGWMAGQPGARAWRKALTDFAQLNKNQASYLGQVWDDWQKRAQSLASA